MGSNKRFAEHSGLNLSDINKDMLAKWQAEDLFKASLAERAGAPKFIFYEGPPSANGMPGIHHVMARTIKDLFCRYKTMKGYLVERKAGWDTHGLPVELGVEKRLHITKADIGNKISVEEYNQACREEVMKYTAEWRSLTEKMGYWVDMDHPYITYDNRYIETLWYLLKQLYEKGLLYKGYTIQPYSPAAGTGLSSHELNQPGTYRDVKDTMATVMFEIKEPAKELTAHGKAYFIAWTTTPWTLPSNTALAVGPKIEYVAVQTYNPYSLEPMTAILAKPLLSAYFNPEGAELPMEMPEKGAKVMPYRVIKTYTGSDLEGMRYQPLFSWVNPGEGAYRVITGDFVSTEDGTGIVHIAPTFGADDQKVANAHGVPALMLLDKEGKERPMVDLQGKYFLLEELDPDFVSEKMDAKAYQEFEGRFVKNSYDEQLTDKDETLDISICMQLKQRGLAFKIEKQSHSYPHCWRTDKPILYYPLDSWFIRSTALKERMQELNNTIYWKPASTGSGRFGMWLQNLQDWNLSRSRYWGTPLPIWRTEDGREELCIGSVEELKKEIDKSVAKGLMKQNPYAGFVVGDNSSDNYGSIELHRPYVDEIVLVSASGQPMYREKDLIDVWFDSGAMPYAQLHYPFENKELIDDHGFYPADFIAEGVDQTRGWFFTLHAISTMIFDSVAFKNVISNGLVLDKNGNKMSKRLGNGVDPFGAIEEKGSDPLRWYMISNSSPWDNLRFDMDGVDEVQRKFFGTLFNTYSFFALYANIDHFDPESEAIPYEKRPELDRWIISALNSLIKEVTTDLDDYEPTKAARAISDFVNDQLSNWYVRLARKRFWGGGMSEDKVSAYQTLYHCLVTVAKLIAPVSPFYADRLYRDLTNGDRSVHLTDFPEANEALIHKGLEESMDYAQRISSMVLALRRRMDIKVRQPLSKFLVLTDDAVAREAIDRVKELILNEVNVKELVFADTSADVVQRKIKPNFKALGPVFGKEMKQVAAYLGGLSNIDIIDFQNNGKLEYLGKEILLDQVEVISDDVPGWLVQNEGAITVALDETITPELRLEGLARELVNRIQNIRKAKDFNVSDKINIVLENNSQIEEVLKAHHDYIATQVQALEITMRDLHNEGEPLDLDEEVNLSILINKAE
ncbi:isoleucine--tRNA ligase [Porphyromonas somerae]|uniref:isoleucine--tRNA ligase n=1 Tax=Porphyromonas somerae TaxID=322095 RepID=UPI002A747F19|nr:isoleucine--tRNA ligase [Porphyromonas somerae]MDY3120415.1 isoleucine--tRNA ligase [Porphyromonas somerae]